MRLLYFVSVVVVFLKARAQDPLCESGEYLIDRVCCPMCDSGNRVHRPCTATISGSTSCIPCMAGTYMEHPNGLTECFKCKSCDPGSGLRVKSSCTYTRNVVCSCMDGYYCLNPASEDCDLCEMHTVCRSGEKVKVAGTEITDTICEKCPHGTFSNQTMSKSCVTWTSCRVLGRTERAQGTDSSDAVCSDAILVRIGAIASGVFVFITLMVFITKEVISEGRKEKKKKDDKSRTTKEPSIPHDPRLPVQETEGPSHAEISQEPATPATSLLEAPENRGSLVYTA